MLLKGAFITNDLIISYSLCAPQSEVPRHTEYLLSSPSLLHDYDKLSFTEEFTISSLITNQRKEM